MGLVTGGEDALSSIIPFDNPKHPRLPSNRFPSGGRAGGLTKVAQVAWITGKYLYKYRKKWLAGGLALSVGASTLFQNNAIQKPSRSNNQFNKTYNRRGGRFNKRKVSNCSCKRRWRSKRSNDSFRGYGRR